MLFDRVYGALIGSAIGDAMGAPVEMLTHEQIKSRYGHINDLLEYGSEKINAHGPWDTSAGAYTDDSRMNKLFCMAIIEKGGEITKEDLIKAYCDYYYAAPDGLPKQFVEEYFYKAIYNDKKQIFGGQPTNGAIMGIAPFGVINLCRPQKAHNNSFDTLFITEGYARYSASIAAAAIAASFSPRVTSIDWCIEQALSCVGAHKACVEGEEWKAWKCYDLVAAKNEQLIRTALDIVHATPRDRLYTELTDGVCQQFFADGAETLAIAFAFSSLANGDFATAVTECVNFGRDCDSTAAVAGALCGAFGGMAAIPAQWVAQVEAVNPGPRFDILANSLCSVVEREYHVIEQSQRDIHMLLQHL